MRLEYLPPLVLPLLLACRSTPPTGNEPTPSTPPPTTNPSGRLTPAAAEPSGSSGSPRASATRPARPVPPASAEDLRSLARSCNTLGLEVYAWAREQQPDAVLSPASIAFALGMTYLGARGNTAAEMKHALHLSIDEPGVGNAFATLLYQWLADAAAPAQIAVANRLFVERSLPIEPAFVTLTTRRFGAPAEPLDFVGHAEAARQHINGWVEQHTKGRIRGLMPPHSITTDSRLVLTNALHFKGLWLQAFDVDSTRQRPFFGATGKHPVATMHNTAHYRYADLGQAEALELPYQGHRFAMTVLLPKARDGLAALEASLTATKLAGWLTQGKPQRVRLALPRFRLAPQKPLRLAKRLQEIGMTSAFDRVSADFTAIAKPPSPADNLYIAEVFHKAFVEVNETGTEAAAATAVSMAKAGAAAPADEPRPFIVDHPFLFVIRDQPSGTILFIGRVSSPQLQHT